MQLMDVGVGVGAGAGVGGGVAAVRGGVGCLHASWRNLASLASPPALFVDFSLCPQHAGSFLHRDA